MVRQFTSRRSALLMIGPAITLLVLWGCDSYLVKGSLDSSIGDATWDGSGPPGDASMDSSVDTTTPVSDASVDTGAPPGDASVDSAVDSTAPPGDASVDSTVDTTAPAGDASVDSSVDSGAPVDDATVDTTTPAGDASVDGTVDSGVPVGDSSVDGTVDSTVPVGDSSVDSSVDSTVPVGDSSVDSSVDLTVPVGDSSVDSSVDSQGTVCDHDGSNPTVTVSSTQDLQNAINSASGLTVIWVDPGTYTCIEILNKTFTQAAPLIIRKNPAISGTALFNSNWCWETVNIDDSSYIVFDGMTIQGGGVGVYVRGSDHLILRDLTISGQEQEGIRVAEFSSYVDILNCHINDTGNTNPQWGEGIYIGSGSGPMDIAEYVWIENNEISDTGNSEGINIKAEVFHTTVRGNNIHHISPGTATQYNQSALTVESSTTYLSDPREVWVENNTVSDVTFGQWASGIMVGGSSVYVVNNTVTNYEEYGIYVNSWGDLGLPCYLWNNQVDTSGQQDYYLGSGVDIRESDPGANPHSPQSWYCR